MALEAQKKSAVAALLHGFSWEILEPEFRLDDGIALARFRGSVVQDLYQRACKEERIDYSDPYHYDAYLIVEPTDALPYVQDFGDRYGLIDRLCNIIALVAEQPVPMCRVFCSSDFFRTYEYTSQLYVYGLHTEALMSEWGSLNNENKFTLRKLWQAAENQRKIEYCHNRIANALTYFYLAWRSHIMEQTCINLAICIEILFAPHSQSEVSHQISFNVSKFMAATRGEREQTYLQVKKFYSLRSSVVHGGIVEIEKLATATREMFFVVAQILKIILLDPQLSESFRDEEKRKQILRDYLFD